MNLFTPLFDQVRLLGRSFQAKLMLLLLLPLLVVWSLVVVTSEDMLERQRSFVGEQQVAAASLQAAELDDKIKDRFAILAGDAAGLDLTRLAAPHYAANYLAQRFALKPIFTAATVIYDRSGTILGDYPVLKGRQGHNFAEREYLQRLYATGQPTISPPYMGIFVKVMVINLCVPIKAADQQVRGALCGYIDVRSTNLFGRLSNAQAMGDNGVFVIRTKDRVLIASTESSRVMEQLPDNALVRELIAGSGHAFVASNRAGVQKLYASAPVPSAGWVLALGLPTGIAYAPVQATVAQIKSAALLASLLVVLATFFLTRRLVRPLKHASHKMDAMTSGREPLQRVCEKGDTEVRGLLTSFNRLSDSISSQQTQLQSARNELLAIFDNLGEAVFVFGAHNEVLRVNPIGHSMHGLFAPRTPMAEVMAQIEMLDPDGEVMPAAQWPSRRAMRGDFVHELELHIRRKDTGATRYQECSSVPIRDDSGELTMFVITSRDITERKLHADLLGESEAKLRQSHVELERRVEMRTADLVAVNRRLAETQFAMDSVGIGIQWIDAQSGHLLQVNKTAAEMLGYSTEELIGMLVSDIDPNFPAEGLHQGLEELRQLGQAHFDSVHRSKDGRTFPVELTIYFLAEVANEPPRFIVFVTDISMRKEAESALIQAKKLADAASLAKSDFLANMSHEIRSPLNGILGLAYLLEQSTLDPQAHDRVCMIRVSGRLLLSLINDILDMSKIEAGQMTVEQAPFRLGDVIENVAGSLGVAVAKKAIEIVISPLPAGVAYIVGDALRLEQVLTNLCSNAEKFTQTGSIRLSTSVVSETHASAMLRFSVTDTGLGIQPELQSGIFAAFSQADTSTTRRFGGTGLGLAICQQLVVLMGGDIGVISTLGVGSEFWFTVPLQHANASDSALLPIANQTTLPAPSSAVQATGGHLAGLRILVVDDSDINRGVLQHILVGQGAIVSLAEDGQQAMDWLLAHADAVDIVLMDVQMPVLDGMEATRRLRCLPQFAALPIVALTAGVFKSQHEAALAAGMTHFVSKPFDVRSTIALIQRLCSPLHSVPPNATLQIPTANAAPAIADIDVAQGLKLWQDNATYQAYLRRFVSDYRDAAVVLQDSLARGDRQGAAALAHKLSGVAANLALPNTRHAAQALERLLATPDDPALALTLLHQSLSAAVAEINRYAPPAPAAHEASEPVSQQPLSLTPAQQQALKPLLVQLLAALDTDNATPAKKCLAVLSQHLPSGALAAILDSVLGYDFRGAEAHVLQLAARNKMDLME